MIYAEFEYEPADWSVGLSRSRHAQRVQQWPSEASDTQAPLRRISMENLNEIASMMNHEQVN